MSSAPLSPSHSPLFNINNNNITTTPKALLSNDLLIGGNNTPFNSNQNFLNSSGNNPAGYLNNGNPVLGGMSNNNPFFSGPLTTANTGSPSSFAGANPFSAAGPPGGPPNPFQAQQTPKPSMNQLRGNAAVPAVGNMGAWGSPQPQQFNSQPAADENPFFL